MLLKKSHTCDVLVIGSGIAGISAAITAAESGCSVILACKGKLFSGSSFYPGTWGLGLIGPAGQNDEQDLADTIQTVGCNMADPELVKVFVHEIQPAIQRLRSMGMKLRRAENASQKEFIPCFDHKHRDWNGIEFDSAQEIFSQRLNEENVQIFPLCEALELVMDHGRVCGAIMATEEELFYVSCCAVVLATGGYGSLFKYHLCTEDVVGSGQYLALKAGCELVNMEFMQMMPGFISPANKTVFNEKTFRFTHLYSPDGTQLPILQDTDILAVRSGHGPFTCRLPSKAVDLAIFEAFLENEAGVMAYYSEEIKNCPPEFIKVYFDWLLKEKRIQINDPVQIGIFAHAANGGIRIKPDASTNVPGLYAAGEVTGGMHGADRIGGLSTANGLVFGSIAGRSAAQSTMYTQDGPAEYNFEAFATVGCENALKSLRQVMFQSAMILRNETGLNNALHTVNSLRTGIINNLFSTESIPEIKNTHRFLAQCATAESVLRSALLRKESRGSHYRTDYPKQCDSMEKQLIVSMNNNSICVNFSNK